MKIPKSLAACADALWKIKADRLAAQKIVDQFAAQESELREYLINNLPKSDATGVSGKLANVKIETKTVALVEDWDKFYTYVVKNYKKGSFALLQRRLNSSAVQEIWENHKEVPGVGAMRVPVISLTKR